MKFLENIREITALKPDYLGFIFYEQSPRFVGEDFEILALEDSQNPIEKTAVFVNESNEVMEAKLMQYGIKTVQLHGGESTQQCRTLKQKGYTVIKAFSIGADFDFSTLKDYEKVVDYFLFDTQSIGYGGSGISFNWDLLQQYQLSTAFFLSGGLGLHNVQQFLAVKHLMLYGYDFNSSLESEPGLKDRELVQLIIKRIKKNERI